MIRFPLLLLCILSIVIHCGCIRQDPIEASEEDETIIRGLETRLVEALSDKDLDRFVSLYADDAMVFYPNNPPITGREALKQVWEDMFARSGFTMSLQAVSSEVSLGGDLAYAHGIFALSFDGETGAPVVEKGNYIVIFKKQTDGQWKIIMDIATPDHPVAVNPGELAEKLNPALSPDGKWVAYNSGGSVIHIRPVQ